jgi:hypothetical protein
MTTSERLERTEAETRALVRQMSSAAKRRFHSRLEKAIKDPDFYAMLCYATLFAHHLYLGQVRRGAIAFFGLFLGLVVLAIGIAIGFSPAVVVGAVVLVLTVAAQVHCLINSQHLVREFNVEVEQSILRDELSSTVLMD